jgi:hypothetical protein
MRKKITKRPKCGKSTTRLKAGREGEEGGNHYLHSHGDIGGLVIDLLDGAVLSLAKLLEQLELLHVDLEAVSIAKVDAVRVQDRLSVEVEFSRRITVAKAMSDPPWIEEGCVMG